MAFIYKRALEELILSLHVKLYRFSETAHLGHVNTNTFSFENAYFTLRFGLPSTLRRVFVKETEVFENMNLKMPFSCCSVDHRYIYIDASLVTVSMGHYT